MIKVVIDRRRWYRGESEKSRLLLENGKMCCIGFLARKLGYKPKDIRGICTLADTTKEIAAQFTADYCTTLGVAYGVNDNESINDAEREKALKEIGKEMGVRFVFKN